MFSLLSNQNIFWNHENRAVKAYWITQYPSFISDFLLLNNILNKAKRFAFKNVHLFSQKDAIVKWIFIIDTMGITCQENKCCKSVHLIYLCILKDVIYFSGNQRINLIEEYKLNQETRIAFSRNEVELYSLQPTYPCVRIQEGDRFSR